MLKKKGLSMFLVVSVLSMLLAFPAMAASSVSSISLKLSYEISAGDTDTDVTVTTSSSKYEVTDVEVTNEPSSSWKAGNTPKIKVTLETDTDDYTFSSGISRSDVSLSGDSGTVTSVSRKSSGKLYVNITLAEIEDEDYSLTVSNLTWGNGTGVAYWTGARDAQEYEVKLYRGSSSVTSVTTTNTYYNFSSNFTKSGTYSFKVRAVYDSSNKGDYVTSDELTVTSDEAEAIVANGGITSGNLMSGRPQGNIPVNGGGQNQQGWIKDNRGWVYRNSDQSHVKNQWKSISGKWYFFDNDGYMKTGWIQDGGKWYYCNEDGEMLANTRTPDGYYVGADGAWIEK